MYLQLVRDTSDMPDATKAAAVLVRAKNLRKSYIAKAERSRASQLSGLFAALASGGRLGRAPGERFVALEGATFELRAGESIGVIGRNGSGKSTLMKVVAGVLTQDDGLLEINGSLQALINLGAGFDKQLSGRENIRTLASLYGIFGARLEELVERVIEFSELGEFIDRPIETYSSGMAARLGFALCTHLDPQILIIDEALSVGDGAFQNKCLLKLEELRKSGLSLFLVSHSMAHILQFCKSCIWLDRGRVVAQGPSQKVVKAYSDWLVAGAEPGAVMPGGAVERAAESEPSARMRKPVAFDFSQVGQKATTFDQGRYSTVAFSPKEIVIRDESVKSLILSETYGPVHALAEGLDAVRCSIFNPVRGDWGPRTNEPLVIDYEFQWLGSPLAALNVSLHIYRDDGRSMTTITTLHSNTFESVTDGLIRRRVEVDDFCLRPGKYVIMMPIHEGRAYLARIACAVFEVRSETSPIFGELNFACRYLDVPVAPKCDDVQNSDFLEGDGNG